MRQFNAIVGVLEDYTPKNNKYIEAKNKLLNNVKKIYEGREKIIEGFKNGIFPFNYDKADGEQLDLKDKKKGYIISKIKMDSLITKTLTD